MCMDLSMVRMPDFERPGMRTQEMMCELAAYMEELVRQIQYTLGNLDENNLGQDLRDAISQSRELTAAFSRTYKTADGRTDYEQTAQRINLSVQRNGVINAINLSKEGAKIQAAKLALEGLTTINGAFRVLLDGSFEATAGRIGGWTVDETSLYTGKNTTAEAPRQYNGTTDLKKPVAIAGSLPRKDWRLKVGENFGITADGALFCERGVFRGAVSAGAIIGGDENGTIGSDQMEPEYAQMKELLNGAVWTETTIDGTTVQVLTKEAGV